MIDPQSFPLRDARDITVSGGDSTSETVCDIMCREMISANRAPPHYGPLSDLQKARFHASPQGGVRMTTWDIGPRSLPSHTARTEKNFPMESWNYGYSDIGESFGGNRGTALRASRRHSCENPKTRRYCALRAAYISRINVYAYAMRTHIHTRTHIHACTGAGVYRCFRFYYSNLLTGAIRVDRASSSRGRDRSSATTGIS